MHFSLRIFFIIIFSLPISKAQIPVNKKYIDSASKKEGDPANGKKIFFDKRTLCSECHSLDGNSNSIGPDLSAAGDKFSRADLIHSVINPSANIMTGYATTIIETTSKESWGDI